MKSPDCVFCNIADDKIILKNDLAFVISDKYPHSKGHVLIVPYSHHENYFDISIEEQHAISELLNKAKMLSEREFKPDGYNINVNVGRVAGQIVMHAHVHLIPRYR